VSSDFKQLLSKLVDIQVEQSNKLDKIAALLLSNQLLTECIDHNGKPRDADTAAEIVSESFSAGLCLLGELENRNKQYLYQMQEFFLDDNESSIGNDDLTNPF
tara:strand:- start:981 stop:1289 length:309 start_codon:yes stop_codon:yes gene_type:complete